MTRPRHPLVSVDVFLKRFGYNRAVSVLLRRGATWARFASGAWALCALAWMAGCATTQKKDQPLIQDIRIEGTKQVPEGEIKARILTSEQPLWPWQERSWFDANAWQADLRRIQRLYESRGYYQARVLEDEVLTEGDGVSLRVRVQEGEPTRIKEVRIHGLDALTPDQRARLLDRFPLREGEIFLEQHWVEVKSQLLTNLRELGFADAAEPDGSVQIDVDTREAIVELRLEPGPRFKFGRTFVAPDANAKVPNKQILEQVHGAIVEGQWYSESALAEAQSRVFKMGVFGGVKVNRGIPDRAKGIVPVIVDVREAPFHTLRAGVGFGLDQSRQEARALAEYIDRDFFGGLRSLQTQLKVGWAFLPNVWDVVLDDPTEFEKSLPLASISAEFSQPRVVLPTMRYFAALQGEFRPEQGYEMLGGRAETGLVWTPHPSVIAQVSYNFEAYKFLTGNAFQGDASRLLGLKCAENCTLSFIEPKIEWDRRRNHLGQPDAIEPTRGYYLSLGVQLGGGILGGSFPYTRILPEARYYTSMLPEDRLTFAFRLRAGTLLSNEESPLVSRFYAGGGNSVRGFSNRRLSPLLLVRPNADRPEPGSRGELIPMGGERLFEGSVEARYKLNDDFALALFVDTGFNTLGNDEATEDLNVRNAPAYFGRNLQTSVGIGMRYLTLVGPIRVDFAYRLPFGRPPTVAHFEPDLNLLPPPGGGCFGIGDKQGGPYDNPEPACALHISIGEAF
ncbi:MAG: BamA/TamA family outer membrane protein [Myxococcaceae bacterium]